MKAGVLFLQLCTLKLKVLVYYPCTGEENVLYSIDK